MQFKSKQVGYHQPIVLAFNSNDLANVLFQELWTVEAVSLKTHPKRYFIQNILAAHETF